KILRPALPEQMPGQCHRRQQEQEFLHIARFIGSIHAISFFSKSLMVLLVMIGLAQKPTLRIYPIVKYKKSIPLRNPTRSPSHPMISGTIAPPIIPVTIIPENEP